MALRHSLGTEFRSWAANRTSRERLQAGDAEARGPGGHKLYGLVARVPAAHKPYRGDVVQALVIAGSTPTEPVKRRSFEVFRNFCEDVEVVTFDELMNKLSLLQNYLAPPENPADDLPF